MTTCPTSGHGSRGRRPRYRRNSARITGHRSSITVVARFRWATLRIGLIVTHEDRQFPVATQWRSRTRWPVREASENLDTSRAPRDGSPTGSSSARYERVGLDGCSAERQFRRRERRLSASDACKSCCARHGTSGTRCRPLSRNILGYSSRAGDRRFGSRGRRPRPRHSGRPDVAAG
jgi:hypothetical protein